MRVGFALSRNEAARRDRVVLRGRAVVTQRRVTAVPTARIGKPLYQQDRGAFQAVIAAPTRRAFDLALSGALGLPPPEKSPPERTKAD